MRLHEICTEKPANLRCSIIVTAKAFGMVSAMPNLTNISMILMRRRLPQISLATAMLLTAAVVLAADPVIWLISTWRDPAYDSYGALTFFAVVALLAWSASSPIDTPNRQSIHLPAALLVVSGLVRLAGQLLAVNTIGAIMLIIDVYALAVILRLDQRRRALSPIWLAISFAFTLPLERIVQRSIGYLLQQFSADGACVLLGTMFTDIRCEGVRLILDGRDVLVDLPCSGARTALLSLLAFSLAACLARPSLRNGLCGLVMAASAAYAANVLRISALAVGLAHPSRVGGIDVMAPPWHDAIGAIALAMAMVPIIIWLRCTRHAGQTKVCPVLGVPLQPIPTSIRNDGWWLETSGRSHASSPALALALGLAALLAATAIVSAPQRPIDVARREARLQMPGWLSGLEGEAVDLTPREAAYFTAYGGAAAKARYGAHTLMVIRTSSPLRHLHAPDECLRGLGFRVRYVGLQIAPAPTAVYLATSPSGSVYRVDVTYLGDDGQTTSNIATAVWHWLNGRARTWTAIQRISPLEIDQERHSQWSAAALNALSVPTNHATAKPSPGATRTTQLQSSSIRETTNANN